MKIKYITMNTIKLAISISLKYHNVPLNNNIS